MIIINIFVASKNKKKFCWSKNESAITIIYLT